MVRGVAPGAADHAVHVAFAQHHAGNKRQTPSHFDLCDLHRHPAPGHERVIGLPKVVVTVVLLNIDHVVIEFFFQAQTKLFNALGNDGRATNQGGTGQAFVHHDLAGAQHALFLALGIGHAFVHCGFGSGKDGLHHRSGCIYKTLQPFSVGVHVLNGALSYAAVKRGLRHGRRNLDHQARVKRLGNQVFRAKCQLFPDICCRHDLTLLGLRQLGNGMHRRNFHLDGDGGRTRIQRAAKNVRKAQDIVDLVRVVGAPGCDDGVIAHHLDVIRVDFRIWIGKCKDDGFCSHLGHHVLFQHTASRQTQKNVGALNDLAQRARVCFLGEEDLVFVHQLGSAFVDHACQIGDVNVFA